MSTATVYDVAKYILDTQGEITAMKLQKLAFYVKAWALVWEEKEIFPEHFEAWANGAVSPDLYKMHAGMLYVTSDLFPAADTSKISEEFKTSADSVLKFYGQYSAQQLSDINHQESPWLDARGDLPLMARSNEEITPAAMFEYYSGLWNDEGAE